MHRWVRSCLFSILLLDAHGILVIIFPVLALVYLPGFTRIAYAGVGKTGEALEQAISLGVGCLNVESAEELELVARVAAELRRTEPWFEPALPGALAALSESQRTAVLLVLGLSAGCGVKGPPRPPRSAAGPAGR